VLHFFDLVDEGSNVREELPKLFARAEFLQMVVDRRPPNSQHEQLRHLGVRVRRDRIRGACT
jgi:hypothetical protein